MIRKTLLFSVALSSALLANSITFENAPQNPTHRLPNSANEIMSFNGAIQDSMNAVVNISTRTINYEGNINRQFFREFFGNQLPPQKSQNSLGSGVIISKDGYIVTNNHVIDGADEISVTIHGQEKEYLAEVVGRDQGSDLAVIKIKADNLKPITFSHIEDVKIGDVVFAIGNPFGVGQTVTQGIVSALNKYGVGINQYENFIQTDASINPGNSGGALIDSRGALIGINSAILSRTGGNHGIGFSIPVDMVKNVVSKLVLDGEVQRGFMGVNISKVTDELKDLYSHKKGAIITNIQPNSPADKAELQRGDLIYAIDGKRVKNPHDLQRLVTSYRPDETIKVSIERDGKELEKKLILTSMYGDKVALKNIDASFEGLYLNELNDNARQKFQIPSHITGVLIEDVEQGSAAYQDGFVAGDVLIQIENQPIKSLADATEAFTALKGKTKRIYINRRGSILLVVTR